MERSANRFVEAASGQARDLKGTVKLTTEEIYAQGLLAPFLRELG